MTNSLDVTVLSAKLRSFGADNHLIDVFADGIKDGAWTLESEEQDHLVLRLKDGKRFAVAREGMRRLP